MVGARLPSGDHLFGGISSRLPSIRREIHAVACGGSLCVLIKPGSAMATGEGPDDGRAFVRAFWRELDSLRRERGMSYKQLERRTKIACSTLQYWMTGSRRLLPWMQVRAVVLALEAPEELWFDRWKQADHRSALNGPAAINSGEFDGDAPLSGAAVAAQAQLPMDILE